MNEFEVIVNVGLLWWWNVRR